jgi:hypothetical protein
VKRLTARKRATLDFKVGDWPAELAPTVGSEVIVSDSATGDPVLIVAPYPGDLAAYRRACLAMPMSTTYRASGIRNESQVFGYVGRRALLKREGCRACSAADSAPDAHAVLVDAARELAAHFTILHPSQARADRALVESRVLPDWRMAGSWWTSGVLNRTSALGYHYDRNNFRGTWSAMICCRRGVRGGHLHLPGYDVVIPCADGDVVYFPGSLLMHGVTPFTRTTDDAYRFTAVYYSVSGMAHCGPADVELAAARTARTAREERIAGV